MTISKVIAICNQKGGVAKTTTAISLGAALAAKGKKVLLVDFDSQANLTKGLGIRQSLPKNVATLIYSEINDNEYKTIDAIVKTNESVDVLPASIALAALEISVAMAMQREYLLKRVLLEVKDYYDYIIIDTLPSLGMFYINVLAAADEVLIPLIPSFYEIEAVKQLVESIKRVAKPGGVNPALKIAGIIKTISEGNLNIEKDAVAALKSMCGEGIKIFNTNIPKNVKVKEAAAVGESIIKYAPESKAALAYKALCDEIFFSNGVC